MKKHVRPLWITRNAANGRLEAITTKKPTAAALATIGAPVNVEITTRPPLQTEMGFARDVFALVPQYSRPPVRAAKADARQQALST